MLLSGLIHLLMRANPDDRWGRLRSGAVRSSVVARHQKGFL